MSRRLRLHYLALGHWHSFRQGIAGETTWAYAGAPEPVAVDQDGAGQVLIVDLEERDGRDYVSITPSVVGRTTFRHVDVDAAEVASQAALVEQLKTTADADLVLDVRIVGILPDELRLQDEEIERQLASSFFKVRVRSRAVPAEPEGRCPRRTPSSAASSATWRRASQRPTRPATPRVPSSCATPSAGPHPLADPDRITVV
jgi:DNA repair exonuclease SbcCD nuclease subunit